MASQDPQALPSREQIKSACVAHVCPECDTAHQVSVEEVLTGDKVVIWCHCRACGHSWHPVVQPGKS